MLDIKLLSNIIIILISTIITLKMYIEKSNKNIINKNIIEILLKIN